MDICFFGFEVIHYLLLFYETELDLLILFSKEPMWITFSLY